MCTSWHVKQFWPPRRHFSPLSGNFSDPQIILIAWMSILEDQQKNAKKGEGERKMRMVVPHRERSTGFYFKMDRSFSASSFSCYFTFLYQFTFLPSFLFFQSSFFLCLFRCKNIDLFTQGRFGFRLYCCRLPSRVATLFPEPKNFFFFLWPP